MKYLVTTIVLVAVGLGIYAGYSTFTKLHQTITKMEQFVDRLEKLKTETQSALSKSQEIEARIGAIPAGAPKEVREVESATIYFPKQTDGYGDGRFYLHIPPTGNYLVKDVLFVTK